MANFGCRIYANRPPSCHDFICRWLTDPVMGPEWKPNVCKMVIDCRPSLFVARVDPAVSQPWRAEPYLSVLKRLSVQGLTKGVVMVIKRRRTTVILPDCEVDLGVNGPDVRIAMEPIKTPAGTAWQPGVVTGSRSLARRL